MKFKHLFILSLFTSLSLVLAACDDGGSKKKNPCGNGVLDPGEECDGENLNQKTCAEVTTTKPGGTLKCTATCTFDTTECTAPECGNSIIEGSEECDGSALGDKTCADIPGFKGGTLGCSASCTYDTTQCEVDCNVEDNFEPCNPMGGNNECCPHNGLRSQCFSSGEFRACLQTCSNHTDCGWSMECLAQIGGLCYVSFCGAGMQSTDLQDPCRLDGNRDGVCYPLWRAMDDSGICLEAGSIEHGGTCPMEDVMGQLDVNPNTQCKDGFCFGPQNATEGKCFKKCNPIAVYDTKTDSCPTGSTCLNFSSIDLKETFDDGSANPNFLFREPDLGVCYIYENDNPLYSCDLATGNVINGPNPGSACPTGQTCQYLALGSLLGFCQPVAATTKNEGDTCNINPENPQECAAGMQCFIADPFNDPNQHTACRRICDATTMENNPACAGLESNGNPFVCLTVSRFFTSDHELPKSGSGLQQKAEESPSPLGFCVPNKAN